MNETTEKIIWKQLLELRSVIRDCDSPEFPIAIHVKDDSEPIEIIIADNDNSETGHFYLDQNQNIKRGKQYLKDEYSNFLIIYLPYCFASLKAKLRKRTVAIAHFAQTLDGRIATENGNSKWIGNQENLVHAHRMRALCDGVLIGSGTLKRDNPKLNVRHVSGKNPSKIVVGNGDHDYTSLQGEAKVFNIHSESNVENNGVEMILVDEKDGILNCGTMLKRLFENGINTIYIEGGSYTSSTFLNQNVLDIIQLHIAPIIAGTGIPGFSLTPIKSLDEAITFESFEYFRIGDEMMFTGLVKQK